MSNPEFVPHGGLFDPGRTPAEAAAAFCNIMAGRRSVRMFSDAPVAHEAIEQLVRCATTAPSGANKQPWRFICVSNPTVKREIREGAEVEEREFYEQRAGERWLDDLAPLGTDADKAYLETVPWLVVVMKQVRGEADSLVYYPDESVGIAVGLFLAAAQMAGLATLVHTPSPMKFLGTILGRPANERPFVLIPVGYPAEDCVVPAEALRRRPLDETMVVV